MSNEPVDQLKSPSDSPSTPSDSSAQASAAETKSAATPSVEGSEVKKAPETAPKDPSATVSAPSGASESKATFEGDLKTLKECISSGKANRSNIEYNAAYDRMQKQINFLNVLFSRNNTLDDDYKKQLDQLYQLNREMMSKGAASFVGLDDLLRALLSSPAQAQPVNMSPVSPPQQVGFSAAQSVHLSPVNTPPQAPLEGISKCYKEKFPERSIEGNSLNFNSLKEADEFFKNNKKVAFDLKSDNPDIRYHSDGKGRFVKGTNKEVENYLKNSANYNVDPDSGKITAKENTASFSPTMR